MITTKIQWCDSAGNPIKGCEGCELWNYLQKVCYAGRMIRRFGSGGGVWPEEFTKPIMKDGVLQVMIGWPSLKGKDRTDKPWLNGYPRTIFVNDMSDTWVSNIWVDGVKTPLSHDWLAPFMPAMIESPHIYMLLTKRPSRAVKFFKEWGGVPKNFWLGTSVTYPKTAPRVKKLLELKDMCDGVLWTSLEPLYEGTIDSPLAHMIPDLDWVVIGGESGPSAAVTQLDDIQRTIDICKSGDTRVFVKQLGSAHGKEKGGDWNMWEENLKYREMAEWQI